MSISNEQAKALKMVRGKNYKRVVRVGVFNELTEQGLVWLPDIIGNENKSFTEKMELTTAGKIALEEYGRMSRTNLRSWIALVLSVIAILTEAALHFLPVVIRISG